MEKALLKRLNDISARKSELELNLSNPETMKDQKKFVDQSKELSELLPIIECFEKIATSKATTVIITNTVMFKWSMLYSIPTGNFS